MVRSIFCLSLLISSCAFGMGKFTENLVPSGAQSHFVNSHDNANIHYYTMGTGIPVLLIHGYYADANVNWFKNGIAQELAKTHKVIAMDMRGHGKSAKSLNANFYGTNMWKDALAVLDDQNVQKAHVHGYSMGSTLMIQMLYYTPERVLSATFGGAGITEYDAQEIAKIPADSKPTKEINDAEQEAQDYILFNTNPDHLALRALRKNMPGDGEERKMDLTKYDIPFLALNGEYDSPNRRTHRMQRQLSNFKNVIYPDKGHLTLITPGYMPDGYTPEFVSFIRSQ